MLVVAATTAAEQCRERVRVRIRVRMRVSIMLMSDAMMAYMYVCLSSQPTDISR